MDGLKILKMTAIGLTIMALGVVFGQKIALVQADKIFNKENIITQASIEYFTYLKGINMLKAQEVKEDLENYYIVDLRRANDYNEGHIEGAVNIVMPEIGKAIPTLPKYKTLLLICYSGEWASQTAGILRMAGFDAKVLEGGYDAWIKMTVEEKNLYYEN
ncbi:MAG: rhodanese-like domain-containing protein [Vulcanibacillus sp.]